MIFGGTGNDKIDGGPGEHDIADYQGVGGGVNVDLASGNVSGAENEHLTGIEDAIGGSGNDTLIGSSEPNRLDGGPGSDRLEASGSGDDAFGGPGGDQCTGGFAEETSCGPAGGSNGLAVEIYESIDGQSTLILSGTNGADQGTVDYSGGKYTISGSDVTNGDPSNPDCSGNGTITCTGKVSAIEAVLEARQRRTDDRRRRPALGPGDVGRRHRLRQAGRRRRPTTSSTPAKTATPTRSKGAAATTSSTGSTSSTRKKTRARRR